MKPRELDRWIRQVVLASVPSVALAGCGHEGQYECIEHPQKSVTRQQYDAVMQKNVSDQEKCIELCDDDDTRSCTPPPGFESPDGRVYFYCSIVVGWVDPPGCGRRPSGLMPRDHERLDDAGRWLANAARLESASVTSFQRLRGDLAAFGAPESLCRACTAAAEDERRHARMMAALASRSGAMPLSPQIQEREPMNLEEVARENLVEGCIRETYGALLTTWQGQTAHDPIVRRVLSRIATDERRHAVLSWRIHRWAQRRLSAEARERLALARHEAVRQLIDEVRHEPPAALLQLGVPSAELAMRMAREATRELWAEA